MSGTARPCRQAGRAAPRRCATSSSGTCNAKSRNWNPRILDTLEQHQVERDARDRPGRVAHGHEAAAPVQRAQGGLGELAPDRVDDHVGALREGVAQGLAQVAGAVVDEALRAAGARRLELLGRGGDGGHLGAQHRAELHGRRAHAAAGSQDDELLARLQDRDRSQHVVGGPVGDAERRRHRVVHAGRDPGERGARDDDLLGEGADDGRAEDPVPDGDALVAADLGDHAGELAARDERCRHRHLVRVRDEQHVGEVHRGDVHPDPDLSGLEHGCGDLGELHHGGFPVAAGQRGAHAGSGPRRPARAHGSRGAGRGQDRVVGRRGQLARRLHEVEHDGAERLELRRRRRRAGSPAPGRRRASTWPARSSSRCRRPAGPTSWRSARGPRPASACPSCRRSRRSCPRRRPCPRASECTTQPRSSFGSPTVPISQSTMAARRAGAPCLNMTLANW